MKTGLTLGKYAPFHKGHEFVIQTALQEMDAVVVIVYNASDVTAVPAEIRSGWIQQVFPSVQIIVAEDGPQETGYTPLIIETQNRYILKILGDTKIDAFYSSEQYGTHVSEALGCVNRLVDIDRTVHPVSGTMIRQDWHLARRLVSRCVYDSLKPKIYFLGGPSTGKTTLSQYCAEQLHLAYCAEYGREYWFQFQKNHRLSMVDLETIATEQNQREELASQTEQEMTCIDTSALTTLAYALYYFGFASESLKKNVERSLYKYDHVFLCADDIPFDDTPDRSGPESRGRLQAINQELLKKYGIFYTTVSGTVNERFLTVKKYVEAI